MKKLVSLVLALMMMLSALPMAFAEEYREPITLTVFSQVANFAGVQEGWFAKELKDRFNVTLKFISSNVDPNAFTAGVSAEELGDIICWGDMGEQFNTAIRAELVMDLDEIDMTPYTNLNQYFTQAMAKVRDAIQFHNCLDNVLEYCSDRDSGRMMANLAAYEVDGQRFVVEHIKRPIRQYIKCYRLEGVGARIRAALSE